MRITERDDELYQESCNKIFNGRNREMKKNRWYLDGLYLRFIGDDGFRWYIGELPGAGIGEIINSGDDKQFRELIVKVLNQELPDGKPRSRKRKVS